MEKADRDRIAALHGPSRPMLNMRDASTQISSGSASEPVWRKPPTPITTPSLQRGNQTTNQVMNPHPYSRGVGSPYDNMSSNHARRRLGRYEAYGNTTASRKVFGHTPNRNVRHISFTQGSSNSSRRRVDSADIIEIIDNEEDIGVPVQSDPMNMVDDPPFIPPSKKQNFEQPLVHPYNYLSQDKPHPFAERLPKDGADTVALEKQINNQDSDAIEDFTDDSSPVKVWTQKGNVKEKVTKFEQNTAPHIDLRAVVSRNIKGKMKPKGGNHGIIATSSSKPLTISPHFSNASSSLISTSSARQGHSSIRVKEFFLGTEHKKSALGYYLYWGSHKNIVTIKEDELGQNRNGFQIVFDVPNEIECITSMPLPLKSEITIMEFATSPAYLTGLKRESTTFKMGDRQAIGKITLMFDTGHAGWSDDNYTNLLSWITHRTSHKETIIGPPAARGVWETATRSAEIQQAGSLGKRKNAVEELSQDSRPAKRSAPDSVKTVAMDESTPPPPADQLSVNPSESHNSASTSSGATIIPQPQRTRKSPPAPTGVLRRSSRKAVSTIERSPSVDPDEVILCYPQGVPGAVNITNADFKRLQPGEFLNDTLIEFGLKLWLRNLEDINPELAKQIHVFSSFFYKKLNNKNIEDGYNSVRKWTSKFDLFSKKYIIVPINENLHWYLAIIYHPAHILNPPLIVETQSPTTRRRAQALSANAVPSAKPIPPRISSTSATPPISEAENDKDRFIDSAVEKNLLNFDASCSITVTTESPRSATQVVDSFEDTPLSPLSEMNIDRDSPQEGNLYNISPTVSDYNPGGTPPLGSEMHDADTSSTGTAEVEQLLANDMDVEHAPTPNSVKPSNFYGKLSKKVQGKQRENGTEATSRVISEEEEEEEEPSPSPDSVPTTYIFTLDSLGSKHPQAIRHLSKYLKMEAKDKRNLSETSDPCGKMASVPVQPNFCDCGLYLVHFAQKFVTDPERYCHIIKTRTKNLPMAVRQEDWEESKIADMRENMANNIRQLSIEWKKVKEEARKRETGVNAVEVIESTDDEIDIVETISANGKEKAKGKRGGASKRGPAKRLR